MGKYNKEKYYYFQLKSTFFDNDVISNLESMKNGYEMLILYFKLIFKTINKDGKLVKKIGKEETPYTFDELSKMTGHSFKLIKEGINYFVKSGMMEELPNDTYFIQDALDLTSQTKGAKYQQEYRATHEKPDKCKDKCKDKSKENCQGKIEKENKNNNLELITYKSKDKVIINNDKNIDIAEEIIKYFNFKTGANFRLTNEDRKLINNLLKKYTPDDLRIVIDKKCAEWLNNPKMCVFLKPHVLFGDKFERYLHEDVVLPKRTLKDISYAELDVAIEAEKRKNESS